MSSEKGSCLQARNGAPNREGCGRWGQKRRQRCLLWQLVSKPSLFGLDRAGQSGNVRLLDPSLEKYAESRGSISPWTMSLTRMDCAGGALPLALPFDDMIEGG